MRNFFILIIILSSASVNSAVVTVDWANTYHQLDCANSNTFEAIPNTFTVGYYSLLHNDNDKVHVEFSFDQTVFDVEVLMYVYDHAEDSRVSRIMSSTTFDMCTIGVTYTFEDSGFPRKSQGVYFVFVYRTNASHHESCTIQAHNGLSVTGLITNLNAITFDPIGTAYHTTTSNASAQDVLSGETTLEDPLTDEIGKKIEAALNEIFEKNPVWSFFSAFQGLDKVGRAWVNIFDLFTNPEGRIFELVCTCFIIFGYVLVVYQGKYFVGIFLILICGIPMVTSDQTVLGNTLGEIWNRIA